MMPETFRLEVIRQTAKQYNVVKEQIHRKDVGGIIIATDAGREGELVARLILKKAGARKPLKRLWISSVTDKAIREGFAHLKDGREYEPLYDAAMCRAEADWLVGINATRALTCKYNAQLSCGRALCKSPITGSAAGQAASPWPGRTKRAAAEAPSRRRGSRISLRSSPGSRLWWSG